LVLFENDNAAKELPNEVQGKLQTMTSDHCGVVQSNGLLTGKPTGYTCVLERAGVEFIYENGGGTGVRLRNRQRPKPQK
jgi:hypothetical protein